MPYAFKVLLFSTGEPLSPEHARADIVPKQHRPPIDWLYDNSCPQELPLTAPSRQTLMPWRLASGV
jgi:hypothetical protein